MSTGQHKVLQDTFVEATPSIKEALSTLVFTKFSRRMRELITPEQIADVIETLDLSDTLFEAKAPRLHIHKLRFVGTKRLHYQDEIVPIDYSQSFASGVNVVLIEANEVGKSSIWKTIKFALTGDDSEYDADVRSWITTIWLVFAFNQQPYTIILAREPDGLHALLAPGEVDKPIEEAVLSTSVLFEARGQDTIKQELQHFFFNRLGLTTFAWTNQDSQETGKVSLRHTSWRTYFQALLIPDGGDRYLLCDAQHSLGNQTGLIFSAFLGLSIAEPLNRLGVEANKTEKEIKHETTLSDEEKRKAEETINTLTEEIDAARQRLAEIVADQHARRQAVEDTEAHRHLLQMQQTFQEKKCRA